MAAMLDLMATAAQLRRMRDDLALRADRTGPRLAHTVGAWDDAGSMGDALRERVARAKTSWLVADPLEPLGVYPVGGAAAYRVVGADGSQIFPDRHELPSCFLVNVGWCDVDYRTGSANLGSVPELCWLPDDVYPVVGGIRQEADARVVGARRFAAECDALTGAVGADLLLTDGTLLLWWLEPDPDRLRALGPDDLKTRTFESFERLTATAKANGATVCGYLSSPRSTDVVSMLKVVLCTEDPVDCDRCPYDAGEKTWTPRDTRSLPVLPVPTKPCEEADPLNDAMLFEALLEPGQRSPRFRSAAQIAQAYETPIDFVYLHAGGEIARMEFPAWVTADGLERLTAMVGDQCHKGLGYPVTLSEAHEQAVVRATDRRAFLDIVRRGSVSQPSAKLVRKRASIL